MLKAYYSVIIPWVPPAFATEWHPTGRYDAFSELCRGCFATQEEAILWAREKLNGTPYSLQYTPAFTEES